MNSLARRTTLLALGIASLWLTLSPIGAQGPGISVTPANPKIYLGETLPLTVNGALTPTAVAAGGFHTCMLLSDRTVRCVGRNAFGQLGNGTWNSSTAPVPVSGLTAAMSIGSGNEHSCSLVADGTIRCWGTNYTGQLGDGTLNTYSNVPVTVHNITNAIAAVTGGFHTCAVFPDNTVSCWGRNVDGQVGEPSMTDQPLPVAVAGLGSVLALNAGGYHTCAIMPNRTIKCWGRNDDGQLGDGSRMTSSTPLQVAGITNAAAVRGGGYHACALLQDGTVRCWGRNDYGQVGRPSTVAAYTTPVQVDGISGAVSLVAGGYHSCAVLSDGTMRCWGRNEVGELGDGTNVNSSTPVTVSGIANPTAVSLGALHTCAVMPQVSVQCLGWNSDGQLGNGATTDSYSIVRMSGIGVSWTSSSTNAATVDAAGVATAGFRGSTTITADNGVSGSGSTTLTVKEHVQLSVLWQGDGGGAVTSNPAGINCLPTCTATFDSDTPVTLTAVPAANSNFTSWSGCDSVNEAACTVTMSASRSPTVTFTLNRFALTLNLQGDGTGAVTSNPAGINCTPTCSAMFDGGTQVTLTAVPAANSTFVAWSGCDSVNGAACTVNMNAAKSPTATFNVKRFTLTVTKTGIGSGTVTSSPAGIACGGTCSAPYISGTTVTLTAAPGVGSIFMGWTGCTSSSGNSCTASMTSAKTVTANFLGVPFP